MTKLGTLTREQPKFGPTPARDRAGRKPVRAGRKTVRAGRKTVRAGRKTVRAGRSALRKMPSWYTIIY